MKLNNKGFLITGILYSLLLLFLVLILGMVAILNARQNKLDYISKDIITKLNDKYDFDVAKVWEFDYTGNYQTFTVPTDGYYEIELWGAQGGGTYGGKGAYTKGIIYLTKGENIYIYVGNQPSVGETSFNGGGMPGSEYGYGGGGATDIRLNVDKLFSRIIVAAGGGGMGIGRGPSTGGGEGGAFYGNDIYISASDQEKVNSGASPSPVSTGATQISGGKGGQWYNNLPGLDGSFGLGGNGQAPKTALIRSGAGGGGGYYGGASGTICGANDCSFSGSGGSSFVSGLYGCDAITEESTSDAIVHTGQPNHYSGKVFYNGMMIAGDASMPTHEGTSTMIGNEGNGYAKISLMSSNPDSYTITNMVVNGSFENGLSNWKSCNNANIVISSEYKYYGNNSIVSSPINTSHSENYFVQTDNNDNFVLVDIKKDNKYYCQTKYLSMNSKVQLMLHAPNWQGTEGIYYSDGNSSSSWSTVSVYIDKKTDENSQMYVRLDNDNAGVDTSSYFDGYFCINLTETFGSGNEPTKEWCDENISYFDGEITIYK